MWLMCLAPRNVFYVSCPAQDIDLPGKSDPPTIHPDPGVVARSEKTFQKAPPPPRSTLLITLPSPLGQFNVIVYAPKVFPRGSEASELRAGKFKKIIN